MKDGVGTSQLPIIYTTADFYSFKNHSTTKVPWVLRRYIFSWNVFWIISLLNQYLQCQQLKKDRIYFLCEISWKYVWCVYVWMYTCYYVYNDNVILYYITQALNIGSMYKIMKKNQIIIGSKLSWKNLELTLIWCLLELNIEKIKQIWLLPWSR